MKYVVDFEAWAYEKYRRFKKAQELDPSLACVVSPSSHITVIINMKNGKTRSVGVRPFQLACSSGA